MGEKFVLLWFKKTVDELKAIRETEYDLLTPEQRKQLDEIIKQKEEESK